MTENNKKGCCVLCGKLEILTFEHIPPHCAFNNKSIFVQKHEHLVDEKSRLFNKMSKNQRGFGKYSLCASCNNATGNWYVKDFCDFTKQGFEILKSDRDTQEVRGDYIIKPKNVLKQILLMFVAADSSGAVGSFEGVREYLMDKGSSDFPPHINIYLYSNASPKKRMLGYCVGFGEKGPFQWSEINFHPFGYFLTYKSEPPNKRMISIKDFNRVPYGKVIRVTITTSYLKVSDFLIGTYDGFPDDGAMGLV